MNLIVKGKQKFLGKEIPVIEGGFGEGQRCITANDISKMHNVQIRHINETVNKNIDEFEYGIDILDLKRVDLNGTFAQSVGITKAQISNARNVYIFSESGYLLLCMKMRGRIAKEIRKQFRREYFAMRATLVKQSEYIKVLEERNQLLEEKVHLIQQRDNAVNEINKLNAVCNIPRTQLKKDIKSFLNNSVKDSIFSTLNKEELYKEYRYSRKNRNAQPPRSLFEDIVSELGYLQEGDSWLDIVWK